MKFEGFVRTSFTELKIADISGKDRLCAECSSSFTAGDPVVIFANSVYKDDDSIDLSNVFLVHATRVVGDNTCFEKYVSRVITNLQEVQKPPSA